MIKIGLTGNMGSGKSVVSEVFRILNVPVYNADVRAKNLMESSKVRTVLAKTFGNEILDSDQKPDRIKMADIFFPDAEKLAKLNAIIHPLVLKDFEQWTALQGKCEYVIMESAILFETGYFRIFDKIIFVSAPESIRVNRVVDRDHVPPEKVLIRMQYQQPETEKIYKSDFVILNDGNTALIPQVISIHEKLLR